MQYSASAAALLCEGTAVKKAPDDGELEMCQKVFDRLAHSEVSTDVDDIPLEVLLKTAELAEELIEQGSRAEVIMKKARECIALPAVAVRRIF